MFLQDIPAETTGYMIFGFSVIFGTMLIYLWSYVSRWRNLVKDEQLLDELEE